MLLGNFKRGRDKYKRKSRKSFVFSDKPVFKSQAHVPHNKDKYLTTKGAVLGIGMMAGIGGTAGLLTGAALGKQGNAVGKYIAAGAGLGAAGTLINHTTKQFSPLYLGNRNKKVKQPRKQKELYY
jgi:hypothetical protein